MFIKCWYAMYVSLYKTNNVVTWLLGGVWNEKVECFLWVCPFFIFNLLRFLKILYLLGVSF